ncbi:MAG: methyl-accepting chemotaxis protein [Deltaproteobacteria bacterium]|nr:methyl-accepting chemotaxis protein [Deltaproteobacteria bacterium]
MSRNSRPKYRRRNFFVKKRLQLHFVLGFTLAVLLGFALNLFFVYFLIDRELSAELYRIHLKIRTTTEIAAPIIWKLSAITIPSIIAVSAIIGYYLTRRIELPLMSFREALRKTAQGDFTQRVSIKMPIDLPEVFNGMLGSLGASFRSVKRSANVIDEKITALNNIMASDKTPSKAELSDVLRQISNVRREVTQEFSKFKV